MGSVESGTEQVTAGGREAEGRRGEAPQEREGAGLPNHDDCPDMGDGFNVDTLPMPPGPANVDKKGGGSIGRPGRLSSMPFHPPQPRPPIPLPEIVPAPPGTMADGLEPVRLTPAASAFWKGLVAEDADVKESMRVLSGTLAYLKATPRRAYAERTAKEYALALRRMGDRTPDDMAPHCSKRSAYVYRAALVNDVLSRRMPEAVDVGWRATAAMDVAALSDAARAAAEAMAVLDRYPPDREHRTIRDAGLSGTSFYDAARRQFPPEALAPAKPRKSRRAALKRFPTFPKGDWRTAIWKVLMSRWRIPRRHVAAIAVLSMMGLRPQEVEDGVFVDATRDHLLSVTVLKPAKSHGGLYGLGPRTHTRRFVGSGPGGAEARWLYAYVKGIGGHATVRMTHRRQTRLVSALSRRAMPGVEPAWPYDFRHQYSADSKALARKVLPGDREAQEAFVAERLGHGSARSQTAYGTSSQSRGRAGLDPVESVERLDPHRRVKPSRSTSPMPSRRPGPGPAATTTAPSTRPGPDAAK